MSMYEKPLVECGFGMRFYANGKVKKNAKSRLEPDGDSTSTQICRGLELQACMYHDKRFGLICWRCHAMLNPKKKSSKK